MSSPQKFIGGQLVRLSHHRSALGHIYEWFGTTETYSVATISNGICRIPEFVLRKYEYTHLEISDMVVPHDRVGSSDWGRVVEVSSNTTVKVAWLGTDPRRKWHYTTEQMSDLVLVQDSTDSTDFRPRAVFGVGDRVGFLINYRVKNLLTDPLGVVIDGKCEDQIDVVKVLWDNGVISSHQAHEIYSVP